jgi:hypothetical protein
MIWPPQNTGIFEYKTPCCECGVECCSGAFASGDPLDFDTGTRSASANVTGSTVTISGTTTYDTLSAFMNMGVCITLPVGLFTGTWSGPFSVSYGLTDPDGNPVIPTSESETEVVYDILVPGCYCIGMTMSSDIMEDTVSGTFTYTSDGGDLGCQGDIDMVDETGVEI